MLVVDDGTMLTGAGGKPEIIHDTIQDGIMCLVLVVRSESITMVDSDVSVLREADAKVVFSMGAGQANALRETLGLTDGMVGDMASLPDGEALAIADGEGVRATTAEN